MSRSDVAVDQQPRDLCQIAMGYFLATHFQMHQSFVFLNRLVQVRRVDGDDVGAQFQQPLATATRSTADFGTGVATRHIDARPHQRFASFHVGAADHLFRVRQDRDPAGPALLQ